MSVPVVAFFNNKGGVGKTTLVYHLAWMFAEMDVRVVAADLDPQANLTAAFLDEDRLEKIWENEDGRPTIFGSIQPLKDGTGDFSDAVLHPFDGEERLALVAGDLKLSGFEDSLSEVWPKCADGDVRAFRVTSAFWRLLQEGAKEHSADVVLLDLGPNLGAINRAALISADYLVVPLAPDLFSLQGLRNLGPTIRNWRTLWQERAPKNPLDTLKLSAGKMEPAGYIVMQHSQRLDRPVKAYERWVKQIPEQYRTSVLGGGADRTIGNKDFCLASLKHYRSLAPMAQEAGKPIFHLRPADGAIGAHAGAVNDVYQDFKKLALAIASRIHLKIRSPQ